MKRCEQRCFEIMNMNDKTFIFSDAPSGFFRFFFSGIFRFFFSGKIFRQNFFKNFSAEFFLQNFQRKNFFKNFSADFSAEYFFRITQRNPRIEFIGISFPFNQGFLFLLVAANNFFNSKNILICFFAILLRKMIQLFFLPTGRLIYTSEDLCSIFRRQQIFPLSSSG